MTDKKPMRGCTSPLVHYDDFDFFSEEQRKSFGYTVTIPPGLDGLSFDGYDKQDPIPLEDNPRIDVIPHSEVFRPSVFSFIRDWTEALGSTTHDTCYQAVWYRPKRMPSKANGRKGTRRDWKRKNPPMWLYVDLNSVTDITLESTENKIMVDGSPFPMSFNYEENAMSTNDQQAGLIKDLSQDVLDAIRNTEPGPGSEAAEKRLNEDSE